MIDRTWSEYQGEMVSFYKKHTSANGRKEYTRCDGEMIGKQVCFEDGAVWYEVSRPEWVEIESVVHGVKVKATVKMFTTEYFDSDNSQSRKVWTVA